MFVSTPRDPLLGGGEVLDGSRVARGDGLESVDVGSPVGARGGVDGPACLFEGGL